ACLLLDSGCWAAKWIYFAVRRRRNAAVVHPFRQRQDAKLGAASPQVSAEVQAWPPELASPRRAQRQESPAPRGGGQLVLPGRRPFCQWPRFSWARGAIAGRGRF